MSSGLTVKPIKHSDAGQRMAAIDKAVVEEYNLNGEYIIIESPNGGATTAQAWAGYADDEGAGIIRIDGRLRNEIGVGIDDNVKIQKVDVEQAQSVDIVVPEDLPVKGNLAPAAHDALTGRVLQEGQRIRMEIGVGPNQQDQDFPIQIKSTQPSDQMVVVKESTQIQIKPGDPTTTSSSPEDAGDTLPDVQYEDIGGLSEEIAHIREMIEVPMRHPELFNKLGVEPPRGVLLHGPPGTGKTLLAQAVANEVDASYYSISGPEIMSKYHGESEEKLRDIFERAQQNEPAIVFMDEVDSIAPDRTDDAGQVQKRIVSQMLTLMDGLEGRGDVVVIAATNRPDAIDEALRRGGRFDREIEIGVPDKNGREEILQVHMRGMPLSDDIDISQFAHLTHGFVGADLAELAKESAMNSLERIQSHIDPETDQVDAELLQQVTVSDADIESALQGIEPSGMREVFSEVPDVSWDDIGGLDHEIQRLQELVEWPIECPQMFEKLSTDPSTGVLLYGPPGTGKTMLAKAVANETSSNFISVKGPELQSKWVGESAEQVREIFAKARENAPSVVFFDEVDALAGQRQDGSDGGGVTNSIVSQLLTELDGLSEVEPVVVIGATNRPKAIDEALLRPGRFDEHIKVDLPDKEGREQIFQAITRDKPVAEDVDFNQLAQETEGISGADIDSICREAAMEVARDYFQEVHPWTVDEIPDDTTVGEHHFRRAIQNVNFEDDEFTSFPN
ncbi:Cell division cycle protein [Halorhabdus tiamatea SARL4B]|uniref:Cell division cycle protein n=1 Tax=Halorhabdus tiamatea SARL4B TaxID=1033806 RepID=F7PMK6_9EURY|nr:CDC48 family AAA ATPase [Halorhabdus tiamatea]ERJ07406.1 Cell division cycle protein [Halorhabdus tiamatea SARL4B]